MAHQLLPSPSDPSKQRLSRMAQRMKRAVTLTFANACLFLMLFIVAEGLSSVFLLAWDGLHATLNHGLRHTQYDPLLGWAPVPDLDIPDMYGAGVFLRTNSQGFRGEREYPDTVAAGKRRIICSGDSVTFGQGVDDRHSWCRQLETLDPRLETVTMAFPGYGVDQAYLWYKRDAAQLQHHVQVFAPVADDFRRMQFQRAYGYGKPFLALENGEMIVKNVPVPRGRYRAPWLTRSLKEIASLRVVQALRRIDWMWSTSHAAPGDLSIAARQELNEQSARLVPEILADLKRLNEARSSQLVVVFLPTLYDRDRPDTAFWPAVLERECEQLGIPFVNLAEGIEPLSDGEVARLFQDDRGHLSIAGNQYVAKQVYARLWSIPTLAQALFADDHREVKAPTSGAPRKEPRPS